MRTALTALLLVAATQAFAQQPPKPNVVFILGDNVGYGDLGCYANTFNRTPQMDRLAAEGVRLTQFYCGSPTCTASRR